MKLPYVSIDPLIFAAVNVLVCQRSGRKAVANTFVRAENYYIAQPPFPTQLQQSSEKTSYSENKGHTVHA